MRACVCAHAHVCMPMHARVYECMCVYVCVHMCVCACGGVGGLPQLLLYLTRRQSLSLEQKLTISPDWAANPKDSSSSPGLGL